MFKKINEPRINGVAFFCPKCCRSTKGVVGLIENIQAIECELCGATWKLEFIAYEAEKAEPKQSEDPNIKQRTDTKAKTNIKTIGLPPGAPPRV